MTPNSLYVTVYVHVSARCMEILFWTFFWKCEVLYRDYWNLYIVYMDVLQNRDQFYSMSKTIFDQHLVQCIFTSTYNWSIEVIHMHWPVSIANILNSSKNVQRNICRTVEAANRKCISVMSFKNITFIYRAIQVWTKPLHDKRSTSKKYVLRFTDFIYKLVTWCVGYAVLVNNPIVFRSYLIFDSARA